MINPEGGRPGPGPWAHLSQTLTHGFGTERGLPPRGRVHWPNRHPFITGWLQGLSRSYLSSFIENIWSPGAHQPHVSSARSWGASAGCCCWAGSCSPPNAEPAEGRAQVGWGEIRRAPHSLWERGLPLRDVPSPGSGPCALSSGWLVLFLG